MMLQNIDLVKVVDIAREAGNEIMKIYVLDFEVHHKGDNSPVTLADQISNELIIKRLGDLYPDIPIISEENKEIEYAQRKNWTWFWLIDPLDGTKEFIKKNGEFTVNIALIHEGNPVLGVVYIPVKELVYMAKKGEGAFLLDGQDKRLPIKVVSCIDENLKIAGSRSHGSSRMDEYIKGLSLGGKKVELLTAGSSLKFCMVAEGKAHQYPRFGPTMEWDTAAGHAIVAEAGGQVLCADDGQPLRYNKENLLNPDFIVKSEK